MPYLVIPNEVGPDAARIWVAAVNENFDAATAVLECGPHQRALNAGWLDWASKDGDNKVRYQRVLINNLNPKETYALRFRIGGDVRADASVTTLPDKLPVKGQTPFTVLLGSCFYKAADEAGDVGKTYMSLPFGAQPDVKILCGDQVYLDNPPQDFIIPRSFKWLETRSFKTYLRAWTQSTPNGGFHRLLKNNANFFCSDDHEFWNNAPDVGLNVPLFTATQSQRNNWFTMARKLYEVFQTPLALRSFRAGILSFSVIDTRINRQPGNVNFMDPNHLPLIGEWIDQLPGPGVLVLGQPLLSEKGSKKDWGLPDYQQYSQLIKYLKASKHSIVILTGDVHFGRIASCDLRPELGTKLIEVISSPMQLVPLAAGTFKKAPHVFGSVETEADFWDKKNHFLTLEFIALSSQRVGMQIRFWPIMKNGSPLQSKVVGSFELI
jgi:phosphodiesterase/alkaline phosphatase D-like protein